MQQAVVFMLMTDLFPAFVVRTSFFPRLSHTIPYSVVFVYFPLLLLFFFLCLIFFFVLLLILILLRYVYIMSSPFLLLPRFFFLFFLFLTYQLSTFLRKTFVGISRLGFWGCLSFIHWLFLLFGFPFPFVSVIPVGVEEKRSTNKKVWTPAITILIVF